MVSVSDSWPGGFEFDTRLRRNFFPAYFRLSPLLRHVKKSSPCLWKESCVITDQYEKSRKQTCVTDRHDMTLAVKVVLNPKYKPTNCLLIFYNRMNCALWTDVLNVSEVSRSFVTFNVQNLGERDKECSWDAVPGRSQSGVTPWVYVFRYNYMDKAYRSRFARKHKFLHMNQSPISVVTAI